MTTCSITTQNFSIIAKQDGTVVIVDRNYNQEYISPKEFNEFIKGRNDLICQEKQQI